MDDAITQAGHARRVVIVHVAGEELSSVRVDGEDKGLMPLDEARVRFPDGVVVRFVERSTERSNRE
jgi:hypothetical protein